MSTEETISPKRGWTRLPVRGSWGSPLLHLPQRNRRNSRILMAAGHESSGFSCNRRSVRAH